VKYRFFPYVYLIVLTLFLVGCTVSGPNGRNPYTEQDRGSYRGSYYKVEQGDTLYYIAYITNKNVNDIIAMNRLTPPYTIQPGQKIKLWQPYYQIPDYAGTGSGEPSSSNNSTSPVTTAAAATVAAPTAVAASPSTPSKKTSPTTVDQSKSKEYVGKQNVNETVNKAPTNSASVTASTDKVDKWSWPTKGRVVKKFSDGDQGNKGIDIAGQRGQSVVSTANGSVVYSGSALRGYGNLIIVKHNENYLSAYAHNDKLLVQEGQSVRAGQKIATMGSSGSDSVRLHFEIRYQGKSVNPLRYLP
jgi:lipoprotein NlpD